MSLTKRFESSILATALRTALGCIAVLCLWVVPSFATEHLMVIQEVFVGPPGDSLNPNLLPDQRAQYVILRMTAQGQTLINADPIRVEDKNGNILGNFGSFTANVAAGGGAGCTYTSATPCPSIAMGTVAADNLFTFAFDKDVDAQVGRVALPAAGGRVCFKDGATTQVYDCVAWGNFSCTLANCPAGANTLHVGDTQGSNLCDTNYGTPAVAATGLRFGRTLARTSFNCAAKENSTQFAEAFPKPQNNAGVNNNLDADADGLSDVLDCNDASNTTLWPATEVQAVLVTGNPVSTIAWTSQAFNAGTGVTYDVVRGTLANLSGFVGAACHTANSPTVSTTDATMTGSGNGYFYDVRAGTGVGCVGTYGAGTPGSRDPLLNPICP